MQPVAGAATALAGPVCAVAALLRVSAWENGTTMKRNAQQGSRPNSTEARSTASVPSGRLEAAGREHARGQLDEARRLCLEILAENPRQPEALNMLGMVEYQTGRLDGAVRMLERAVACDPDNPAHYANLGMVLQVRGDVDVAEQQYRHALTLAPKHVETLHNLATLLWKRGQLEEARRLLEQALAERPDSCSSHTALGAILREQGLLEDAESHLSRALAAQPASVEARSALGALRVDQGRLEEAQLCLEQALAAAPDSVEALNTLGVVLRRMGRHEEAAARLAQALAHKPGFVDAINNLGNVLFDQGRFHEAMLRYERAISLSPLRAESYNNLGNALRELGSTREALAAYERAIALDPNYADAQWNRSLIQLLQGNFAEGWRNYEWRNHRRGRARGAFDRPQWSGEPLAGRRILLHAEQGLGDALQFLRYVPMVAAAGGVVLLEVPDQLRSLAAGVAGVSSIHLSGEARPEFDLHCPLMSLPLAFSTALDAIPAAVPYLSIPESAVAAAAKLAWPQQGLRVGIVWSGSPVNTRDRLRSIPLAGLAPLLSLERVHFYSLQLGTGSGQLAEDPAAITDLMLHVEEMTDTAARMAHLDLIVTVDTSVAHLAGALGRPVWVLLPFVSDWRWLEGREDSPWYPTMRLFRQPAPGDWDAVVARLRDDLAACADEDRSLLLPRPPAPSAAASLATHPHTDERERRRSVIAAGQTDRTRWADAGQLEQAWDLRAQRAADYVPAGAAVLDLGCGRMALERFLPDACRYTPCDLVARDDRTVVCDFNAGAFPDDAAVAADIVTLLGVFEYIYDPGAFLAHLRQWNRPVVMSYCATDAIADRTRRRDLGWVNDLAMTDLLALCARAGFSVQRQDRIDAVQWILRLLPGSVAAPAPRRVGVLSFYTAGNFGDRLGFHLLQQIVPAHAEVTHLSFKELAACRDSFDLVIVGVGNSLFGSYIDDHLTALVERSGAAIGIFGTQYHEFLPAATLRALLPRLHRWYARNLDDIFRYGRGLENVQHLGDWLIHAFPLHAATDPAPLRIGKEIWNELPLDRTIQRIQRHKVVFSERIHPLLCALASAEQVGYCEQREEGGRLVSGKFRAMFLDIFGRTFPEDTLFDVERAQVMRYKQLVEANVLQLRSDVHRLLGA